MKERIIIICFMFLILSFSVFADVDVGVTIDSGGGNANVGITTNSGGGQVTYNINGNTASDKIIIGGKSIQDKMDEINGLSMDNVARMISDAVVCADAEDCDALYSNSETLGTVIGERLMTQKEFLPIFQAKFNLMAFQTDVVLTLAREANITTERYYNVVGAKMKKWGYVIYFDGYNTYHLETVLSGYDLVWTKSTKASVEEIPVIIKEDIVKPTITKHIYDQINVLSDLCKRLKVDCEAEQAMRNRFGIYEDNAST